MKSIVSLVFILFAFFTTGTYAHDDASHNAGFCQKAQTTADLVTCSGQHLKAESQYLKTLYDQVATLYQDDVDALSALNDRQNEWLNFRESTCQAEADIYDGRSLSRVQSTSCQARMTADRSQHLISILKSFDEADIPVFSTPPRWINVLMNDHDDIHWKLGQQSRADIDCDGEDEIIVQGLKETDDKPHQKITAIADQNKTGRPYITLLNFDDQKNCDILSDIQVTKLPTPKPESDSGTKSCHQAVTIKTKQCGDFSLSLDLKDGSYTVSPSENMKDKTE